MENNREGRGIAEKKKNFKFNSFDIILVVGFVLSVSVMGLTVYFTSLPPTTMMNGLIAEIEEDNTFMGMMLGIGHHFTIFTLGVVWGGIFTAYHHLRNTLYGIEIAILAFTMFSFNFVHDVAVLFGVWW